MSEMPTPDELNDLLKEMGVMCNGLKNKIADKSGNSYQTVIRHLNKQTGKYYKKLKTYRAAFEAL